MTATRAPSSTLLTQPEALVLTTEQQQKETEMFKLAAQLGYACQRIDFVQRDFAQQLHSRMNNREGKAVYQAIQFAMQCPRAAAEKMFPPSLISNGPLSSSATEITWSASTMMEANQLIGDKLSLISSMASGLSRGLMRPSESIIRVVSTLMCPIETTYTLLPHGAERLYLNSTYVLFDDAGELHPPKDADRREIALDAELTAQLRQQVLQDVLQLSLEETQPLSAGWWRQLGREDLAQEVEAGRRMRRGQRRRAGSLPPNQYQIDRILREVPTTGAARSWFLVRWSGYDASWEPWRISGQAGDPIDTWEPLVTVRRTEAFSQWREEQRALLTATAE